MVKIDIAGIRKRCGKDAPEPWRSDIQALLTYVEVLEAKAQEAADRAPCWCQGE